MKDSIFKILVVSATPFEVEPLVDYLKQNFESNENVPNSYTKEKLKIDILISGVGIPNTVLQLTKVLSSNQDYSLILNLGIAGSFNPNIKLGDVVLVKSEIFGDLGIENQDGLFTDLFEMELENKNTNVFTNGQLLNETIQSFDFLKKVSSLSVNKVHGSQDSIAKIKSKYTVDIESMEGAGVHLVCNDLKQNYLQIRSISNYVEPRNKDNWQIQLAINNLNNTAIDLVKVFQ